MARIANADVITAPATTFGDRGRRRIPARRMTGGKGAIVPGPLVSTVLPMVIGSGHLPGSRVDEHVRDVREQIRREDDECDDHEDALDQRVVELAERVV